MTANSHDRFDSFDEIHELTHAVLHGEATEGQRQRLEQFVTNEEQARRLYVEYIDETVALRGGAHLARQVAPAAPAAQPGSSGLFRRMWVLAAGGIIAASGVVGGLMLSEYRERPQLGAGPLPQRVARVVRSADARWASEGKPTAFGVGDWLLHGRYSLDEGVVQIVFPWGAQVTLEGPAEIELSPEGSRYLHSGQLVAKVPPDDIGFTVETSTVKIIDLGTEFGLSAEPGGASEIHVFRGAVEARQKVVEGTLAGPIKLSAGEATGFGLTEVPVRQIVFNPRRFSKAWRITSGVSETTGAMRFVHPAPASVVSGETESSDHLILFLETESKRLAEPIAVTASQPGLYTAFNDRCTWLPSGIEVDSYLVHFDPIGSRFDQVPVTVEGAVTFDRPIVGVMARGDQLAASDPSFAFPGTQYVASAEFVLQPGKNAVGYLISGPVTFATRGLTGFWERIPKVPPMPNDWFRLSADRRTLSVKCAARYEADQMRILVAKSDDTAEPTEASPARASRPYHGRPFRVDELIEAEDFDLGGDGVGYFDLTPDALANVYRTSESVELVSYLLGDRMDTSVCMTHAGEWLAYTVEIDQRGPHFVEARVASMREGGIFRFEFNETISTPPLRVPAINVYSEGHYPPDGYETMASQPVWLEPGRQTMRVLMELNNANRRVADFDWFRIRRAE